MTDTEALRRALAGFELLCDAFDAYLLADDGDTSEVIDVLVRVEPIHLHKLADAAQRWLALAEGDEAVVERVATELMEQAGMSSDGLIESWFLDMKTPFLAKARSLLVAITQGGAE